MISIKSLFPGMIYSSKDVYNQVIKLKRKLMDGGSLESFLSDVQLEGGNVNWSKGGTGETVVLWIQTKTMAEDVQKTRPWLFQTDTTFKTNK